MSTDPATLGRLFWDVAIGVVSFVAGALWWIMGKSGQIKHAHTRIDAIERQRQEDWDRSDQRRLEDLARIERQRNEDMKRTDERHDRHDVKLDALHAKLDRWMERQK